MNAEERARLAALAGSLWPDPDGIDEERLAAGTLALLDALDAAEAEVARYRAGITALADQWERLATGNEAARAAGYYRRCACQVRALIDGGDQ